MQTDASSPRKGFELILTTPFSYTSSAIRSNSENVVDGRGDFHAAPDLFLKWSRQFSSLKLSASVGVSSDRYKTEHDVDGSAVLGTVKAAWTDGRSDLLVPYVSYRRILDYDRSFRERFDTLDDIAVGVSSGIGFQRDGKPVRSSEAIEPGDRSFGLDLQVGHRLAQPRDLENTFVTMRLDGSYVASKEWVLGLTPKLRLRWYDDYFGDKRRDLRFGAAARATWTPAWLLALLPRSEVDLELGFQRNLSNLPLLSYTQWDLGPSFVVRSKF